MKNTLLYTILLIPLFLLSQTQIGADIDGEAAGDLSGSSVSLSSDGNIIAIGAYYNDASGSNAGQVRIYQNISGTWIQVGADIDGEAAGDNSGFSVSLSDNGSIVAIGAIGNSDGGSAAGQVRIYQNNSGIWTQVGADIDGEAAGDNSGFSVSLSSDGNIIAIGAYYNDASGSNAGQVRIYQNNSGTWTQVGADIDGEAAADRSGNSVSLSSDGSIVAIGGYFNGASGSNAGHVRIYQNNSGTWIQVGADIDGEVAEDRLGSSVLLSSDGSIIAIGADGNDTGHVRIYQNNSGTWTQVGADIDGEVAGDRSGYRVSLSSDGSIVAISAITNDGSGTSSGHVRIHQNILGTWTQIGVDIDGEAAGDISGHGVSLSSDGSIVAIGAIYNDDSFNDAGHVRVFDLSAVVLANDNFVLENFSIHPNPASTNLIIQLQNNLELKKVIIYNNLGKKIKEFTTKTINLSFLSQGTYYVKVTTDKGMATKIIIKE